MRIHHRRSTHRQAVVPSYYRPVEGGTLGTDGGEEQGSAASLASAVLTAEAARQAEQESAHEQIVFPDDLLPGVNAAPMTLRQGLRVGGWFMFLILTAIVSLDELEGAAINVLAPEIQRTFHMSEGAIVFIGTASAAFFVLGAVPMGWLADRMKRVPIVGVSALLFGGFVVSVGLRRQLLHVVLDPVLHRHRQGQHHPRARITGRRRLSDLGPRPYVRRHAGRLPRHRPDQPGAGGGYRRDRRGVTRDGAGRGTCSAFRCRSWRSGPSS